MATTPTIRTSDIYEDAELRWEGLSPIEAVRSFNIENIPTTTPKKCLFLAIADPSLGGPTSGIPVPWEQYDSSPPLSDLRAVSYNVKATGPHSAQVWVRYVNVNPQLFIKGGTGLIGLETDKDWNGNPITVNWKSTTKSGTYQALRPQSVISITQVLNATWAPAAVANVIVGRLNSGLYLGWNQGYVMCQNLSFDNTGFGSVAYTVTAEFRINPLGWQPEVVWTDAEDKPAPNMSSSGTQSSPASAGAAVGRKIIKGYDYIDFNSYFPSPI